MRSSPGTSTIPTSLAPQPRSEPQPRLEPQTHLARPHPPGHLPTKASSTSSCSASSTGSRSSASVASPRAASHGLEQLSSCVLRLCLGDHVQPIFLRYEQVLPPLLPAPWPPPAIQRADCANGLASSPLAPSGAHRPQLSLRPPSAKPDACVKQKADPPTNFSSVLSNHHAAEGHRVADLVSPAFKARMKYLSAGWAVPVKPAGAKHRCTHGLYGSLQWHKKHFCEKPRSGCHAKPPSPPP